eukprot:gene32232-16795_t
MQEDPSPFNSMLSNFLTGCAGAVVVAGILKLDNFRRRASGNVEIEHDLATLSATLKSGDQNVDEQLTREAPDSSLSRDQKLVGGVGGGDGSANVELGGFAPKGDMGSLERSRNSVRCSAAYETPRAVDEYVAFHYGRECDVLPFADGPQKALHFPTRCAQLCEKHCTAVHALAGPRRALDVGCAVGGGSFELAKFFDEVIGVDSSAAFLKAADAMKEKGSLKYRMVVEGDIIQQNLVAQLPSSIDRSRVSFMQADACALPHDLSPCDVILAANVLDRLPEPASFLTRMKMLVKAGGLLVLVSPNSWLDTWTPREKWLGGMLRDGKPFKTADGISAMLSDNFDLVAQEDLPFLMREHARKYQASDSSNSVVPGGVRDPATTAGVCSTNAPTEASDSSNSVVPGGVRDPATTAGVCSTNAPTEASDSSNSVVPGRLRDPATTAGVCSTNAPTEASDSSNSEVPGRYPLLRPPKDAWQGVVELDGETCGEVLPPRQDESG